MPKIKLVVYLELNQDDSYEETEIEFYETVGDAMFDSFGASHSYDILFEDVEED